MKMKKLNYSKKCISLATTFSYFSGNHQPLIEKVGNPKRKYLENTTVGLRRPISMFPGMITMVPPGEVSIVMQ